MITTRQKKGTYFFDTFGEALEFAKENKLPVEDIENIYTTYKITL